MAHVTAVLAPVRLWFASVPLDGARLLAALRRRLVDERDRWVLWLPVALAIGVAVYFGLPIEPPLAVFLAAGPVALVGVATALALFAGRPGPRWSLLLLCSGLLGFAAAGLRTAWVDAPMLTREGVHRIEGRVAMVEPQLKGSRILLDELTIETLAPEATPATIRVSIRQSGEDLPIGTRIGLLANLMPPSPPTHPGGFDFARHAFFDRLGAMGFAFGAPEVLDPAPRVGSGDVIAELRRTMTAEIARVLPGETGAVAAALLTGVRAALSERLWQDMQVTGLVHILSIGGMHLAMIAGLVFVVLRALFSSIPPLALRVVPKKLAAAGAIAVAFFYTLLAGAPVPTLRSFLTYLVALVAVMLDRNPLSMRLLALAAGIVLLVQPEAVTGPSFQMSFAAVAALIAIYEGPQSREQPRPGIVGTAWRYVLLVALTTLVASAATAPFAVYHFQRLALLGIVANLIAVPLTAFWIMPAGLLVLLTLPFGLATWPLLAMGQGVDVLIGLSATMARWPGASMMLPQPPLVALAVLTLGGVWLVLWRGRWRFWGAGGLAVGLLLGLRADPPDLLIDAEGSAVAVRHASGDIALSPWKRNGFVTDRWLMAHGVTAAVPWPAEDGVPAGALACDPLACALTDDGATLVFARRAAALAEDCGRATLVVSLAPYAACPAGAASRDRLDLLRGAGAGFWLEAGAIRVVTVEDARGVRPWTARGQTKRAVR